jgi:hypothetical protein
VPETDATNTPESGASVRLHALFSKVNQRLSELFQALGVKQMLNVPFVHGEDMSNHVQAIAGAAKQAGTPLVKIFLAPHHRENGRGWKSGDGATHGYPTEELTKVIVPKDFQPAIDAIAATRSYLNAIAKFMPDEPTVKAAQEKLKFISATNGSGMNLFHLGTALQQLCGPPTAAISRQHASIKPNQHKFHPTPTPPYEPPDEESENQES